MQGRHSGNGLAWTGFLAAAFGVVGLIGAFATFAARLPFDRAASRSDALTQAVAHAQDPRALDALRPLLGDSADRVLTGQGDIASRAAAERTRMLGELHAEAIDIGFRLRFVIAGFTLAAALFGAMVVSIVRGGPDRPENTGRSPDAG